MGLGAAVATGLAPYAFAVVVVIASTLVGVQDWRRSVRGLLLFLPYSGLLIIATYPATGPSALAKDALFVVPAYLGFGAYVLARRADSSPRLPLGLGTILAAIVLLQMLNPSIPNPAVSVIGAKVWLMYIPMAWLGYHLIQSRDDLEHMLRLMTLAAMVPAVIGIVEGVLVNTGHSDIVYAPYGNAASAVTQGFANVGDGAGTIKRVPSTFSFVGQYYLFTMSMLVVSYAYWRGFLVKRGGLPARLGALAFLIIVLSGLLSGARGAILFVPVVIIVMVGIDRRGLSSWFLIPFVAVVPVALVSSTVFGSSPSALLSTLLEHAKAEFGLNTVQGFQNAFSHTIVGLGTGVDTVSARYALPAFDPFRLVGGRVEESWWVKAVLELGVVGLAAVVVLLGTIMVRALRTFRVLADPQLRTVAAGFVALVAFVLVYNLKGSFLDLDPTNVLFWLFVGILFKLPALEESARTGNAAGSTRRAASTIT